MRSHLLSALVRIPQHSSILFLIFFSAAWFASQLFPDAFAAVELFGSRLAERKRLCVFLLATTAIVLRLGLLWVSPVPSPGIHDEFSYLLAADTFAHGRLTNPPHPMAVYFDTFHVNQQPTYMSIYPPAQGAALALGELLGHPWIGVLLSVSAMTGAVLWALQGWFPSRWALLGGILVLLRIAISSYWINGYWGGAVAAIGGAFVFGALPRIMRSCRARDAVILGLGTGILANSRPFEGFVFCLPVFAVLVAWVYRRQGPSWRTAARQILVPFSAVMLLCVLFMGYYNFRITGHPSVFPYVVNVRSHFAIPQLAWGKTVAPFHFQNAQFEDYYNHWWPKIAWVYGRPDSFGHIALALGLDAWTFIRFVAYPEFLVVALAAPWILRDRRMRFPVAQSVFCFAGFLLVAWFQPHYGAPLTATTFALIVQGLRHFRHWRFYGRRFGAHLSRAVVVSAFFLSPFHPYLVAILPRMDYRQRISDLADSMPGNELIVVRYSTEHDPLQEWVYNAADIDHAKVVWAREIPGVPLQPLLNYFHDRHVWIVEPDDDPPRLLPYAAPATH
jgi:hypothetical protein